MYTRHVAILIHSTADLNTAALKERPGVEIYRIENDVDVEDEIDIALLQDFVSPFKLAFVGGDAAKRFAKSFDCTWIEDSPTVQNDLLAFWGID